MKLIRHRIWDTACKEMIYPEDIAAGRIILHLDGTISYNHVWATENCVLLRSTGLHDKTGKEIFESDLIRCTLNNHEIVGEVKFGEYAYGEGCDSYANIGWYFQGAGWPKPLASILGIEPRDEDFQDAEVIGNVYKNPELIQP